MNETLHTKFGTAKIDNTVGYYRITSKKEGNNSKYLHRLIFEDFYGYIPNNYSVHHKDGNKLNNCILNLQLMKKNEHSKIHGTGENNPFYGKTHSKESKQQMSESHKGKILSDEHKINVSKSRNTSGYFRVSKAKCKDCKQGFTWRYDYYQKGKRKVITSTDIEKLEEKVKTKGLLWKEIEGDTNDK